MSQHLMSEFHFADIEVARDHYELRRIAEEIIALLEDPIGMVCGPISSGGLGSIEKNEQRFSLAIQTLQGAGYNLFNQMPFEPAMKRMYIPDHTGYDWRILHHFYEPIFRGGRIRQKFFIPGWESSTGATWERGIAQELGIEIIDLDDDLLPVVRV